MLGLAALPRCGGEPGADAGLEGSGLVEIWVSAPAIGSESSGLAALGDSRIEVEQAWQVTASVELVACDSATAWLDPRRWLWSPAEAHVISTPTRAGGAPYVRDVATDAAPHRFASMTPPAGSYCEVVYATSAADADAPGLPSGSDMVGRSLRIRGRLRSGDEARPFEISSSLAAEARRPLSPPLVVRPGQPRRVEVLLAAERWFEQLDLAALCPDSAGAPCVDAEFPVLTNMRAAIGVRHD
jgi:hypothetical protein